MQEGSPHEVDYEFLPKWLPLSDLFFVFVFLVEPYTWDLPPTRFLSHHIISVSIQMKSTERCLKPGLIFSALWQRPLCCGYGAAHTLCRELGWPWDPARQSSSSNGRFTFREVLALACRVVTQEVVWPGVKISKYGSRRLALHPQLCSLLTSGF